MDTPGNSRNGGNDGSGICRSGDQGDQGYTGENAEQAAAEHGIRLEVVKLPDTKRGFVLLPRRWEVERRLAWRSRFRQLARDYERLSETLKGLHFLAIAILMAHRFVQTIAYGHSS